MKDLELTIQKPIIMKNGKEITFESVILEKIIKPRHPWAKMTRVVTMIHWVTFRGQWNGCVRV
jgi:hypothetical protein